MKQPTKTSAILLAGGTGTRMQSSIPKQFLTLNEKPIALHSFEFFLDMAQIDEIIVVCPPSFKDIFKHHPSKPVLFALPGKRRQDSVFNGLQASSNELICVHDAARPFIDKELVVRVLDSGRHYGAATAAMPIKFSIKESDSHEFVKNTLDRTKIWEIQTPQVLHRDILISGFTYAHQHSITVTDDVSLAEIVGKQVKLVEGSHTNFKITVPADLTIAHHLLHSLKP